MDRMKLHEAIVSLAEHIADSSTTDYPDVQLYELTNELEDFLAHLMRHSSLSQKDLVEAIESWVETGGMVA